jgi:isoleucyl-tRNA synthetase
VNDELEAEWLAREFVHVIQNLRKSNDFHITDRIKIEFFASDKLAQAVESHAEYIRNETLAEDLQWSREVTSEAECIIGDQGARIAVSPIRSKES